MTLVQRAEFSCCCGGDGGGGVASRTLINTNSNMSHAEVYLHECWQLHFGRELQSQSQARIATQ